MFWRSPPPMMPCMGYAQVTQQLERIFSRLVLSEPDIGYVRYSRTDA